MDRLRSALLAAAVCLPACAAQAVRVHPYPQKFRTFYAMGDPEVPPALMQEPQRLPAGGVNCMAAAHDGAIWLGSDRGLMRVDLSAEPEDRRQYFAGKRYLPDDQVATIAPDAAGGVWVRTATGVSHIELRPMTLDQKAGYFEQRIHARHDRYGLVATSILREPGDLQTNRLDPSDNDGLWTAIYAAAECFRYAVTRAPEALASAKKSIEAVLFLEQVTGRPGFPARSYIRKGDFREPDGIWRWTPDHRYEWKADTSSDEIVGHFFLFSVAWDLLPDSELKPHIAGTVARITDHIVGHGYNLTDIAGKPTTWGRWSGDYFESETGKPDSPLNALELLSFLKTAAHITGQSKYEAEYRKVAFDLKYLAQTTRLAELTHEINYSDEELAMLSFYPVFQYEHDAHYLEFYRRAAHQWCRNIQREKNPLWTFIYQLSQPAQTPDLDGAVRTLYRIPMDMIEWTVRNSERRDVILDSGKDRFRETQSANLLPADERPVMKWNGNPFVIDGGNGGRTEDDGAFFLLPYWMGRYLGMIETEDGR